MAIVTDLWPRQHKSCIFALPLVKPTPPSQTTRLTLLGGCRALKPLEYEYKMQAKAQLPNNHVCLPLVQIDKLFAPRETCGDASESNPARLLSTAMGF